MAAVLACMAASVAASGGAEARDTCWMVTYAISSINGHPESASVEIKKPGDGTGKGLTYAEIVAVVSRSAQDAGIPSNVTPTGVFPVACAEN